MTELFPVLAHSFLHWSQEGSEKKSNFSSKIQIILTLTTGIKEWSENKKKKGKKKYSSAKVQISQH